MRIFFYLEVFTLGTSLSSTYYLIPIFMKHLGHSDSTIGVVGSLISIPYLVINVLAKGTIGRARTSRAIAVVGLGITTSSTLLLFSSELQIIMVAATLIGIATSFYYPLGELVVASISDEDERRRALGVFGVSWTSGFMVGPALSGILINLLGARASFALPLMTSVASLPLSALHNLPVARYTRTRSTPPRSSIPAAYASLVAFSIPLSTMVMTFQGISIGRGISPNTIAISYTVYGLFRMLAYLFLRNLPLFATNVGATLAALLSSACIYLLLLPWELVFPISLAGIGASASLFLSAVYFSILRSFKGNASSAIGLFETNISIGYLIGPALSGYLSENVGYEQMILANVLFAIAAALLSLKSR